MNILHVSYHYLPDIGYQENYLSKTLNEFGHKSKLITSIDIIPKFKSRFGSFKEGVENQYGFEVIRLKSYKPLKNKNYGFLMGLEKIIKNEKPDVVYSNVLWAFHTFQLLQLKKKYKFKLIVDDHIDNGNLTFETKIKKIGYFIFKNMLVPYLKKNVDLVIGVNTFAYERLTNKYKFNNTYFMPLGIDTKTLYQDNLLKEDTRKELGFKKDDFIILFSGNIEPSKDIDILIKAIDFKKYNNIHVVLLGKIWDSYKKEFEKLINKTNEKNIHTIEWVEHKDLNKYYNLADIGILPGKLGGIREIMACGKPLIMTEDKALDYLVDENTTYRFKRGNVKELSNILEKIYLDKDLLSTFSKNTSKLVETKLSWNAVINNFVKKVKEL